MKAAKLSDAVTLYKAFSTYGIEPLLYGSLAASLYIGNFKVCNDIDFIVNDQWLVGNWSDLKKIMHSLGFTLYDEHEHEFIDSSGLSVAFAKMNVLYRDGVVRSKEDIITHTCEGFTIKTLTPQALLRAYQFSEKDGYRKDKRGKKDHIMIDLLRDYISSVIKK